MLEIIGNSQSVNGISLDTGTNIEIEKSTYESKGASIGASFSGGAVTGVDANFHRAKEDGTTTRETHTGTSVEAKHQAVLVSGEDTDIRGSKVKGEQVRAKTGGSLHIESLQDSETYDGVSKSIGAGIHADVAKGKFGTHSEHAAYSKGTMESDYRSVTEQAGIYAGEKGLQIHVEDTTSLKGAVLVSDAASEHNALVTGHLQLSDIHNEAGYKADKNEIGAASDKTTKWNPIGISYSPSIPVKGEASSTTKAAIDESILVKATKSTLPEINRNTKEALQKLEPIFDKKTVEEKQLMLDNLSEVGNGLIGDLALAKWKELNEKANKALKEGDIDKYNKYRAEAKKWDEGGAYKDILHTAFAGTLSSIAGYGFAQGAKSGAVNEVLQKTLAKIEDPELHKLASYVIGATLSGNAAGAAIADKATEYNWLDHEQQMAMVRALWAAAGDPEEQARILAYYAALDLYQDKNDISRSFNNSIEPETLKVFDAIGVPTDEAHFGMTHTLARGLNAFSPYLDGYSLAYRYRSKMERRLMSGWDLPTGVQLDPRFGTYTSFGRSGEGDEATDMIHDVANTVKDFALGASHATVDNVTLDATKPWTNKRGAEIGTDAYYAGRVAGDAVSAVIGTVEVVEGLGSSTVGIAGAPETLGASLVLTAEGVAIASHGAEVTSHSVESLSESTTIFFAKRKKSAQSSKDAEIENLTEAQKFEKSIVGLDPNERVAVIKQRLRDVAERNGWEEFRKAKAVNKNRIIYKDKANGLYYAFDTYHGRFEKLNSKGEHLGEVDIDGRLIPGSQVKDGSHDIIIP